MTTVLAPLGFFPKLLAICPSVSIVNGEFMPNRMIRESARTSSTLYRLSDGAERFFWRLTTVADDFGRFEADPRILKAKCFPLWPDSRMSPQKVRTLYRELEHELVKTYVVEGKTFGFFVTWDRYQTRRASRSKFPSPTDANICEQPLADTPVIEIEIEDDIRSPGVSDGDSHHDPLTPFEKFWREYPRKVAKQSALKAWDKQQPPLEPLLAALRVQKRSREWTKDAGQFVPYPATYLNGRRWEDVTITPDEDDE